MSNDKKRNMKKIVFDVVLIVLAIILIILLLRGCTSAETDSTESESTIETTETFEEATEEVTEESTEVATEAETEAPTEESTTEATTEETAATSTKGTEPKPTETETETIHKHNYAVTDKKEVGCTTDGYVVYTCACGDYYTEKVAARGYHNWSEWSTVIVATTDVAGLMQRTCKDCGEVNEQVIDKLTPSETEPEDTNPIESSSTAPSTEPPTEPTPTECSHTWQETYHEEVGHDEGRAVCACGERFANSTEWYTHLKSYSAVDAILYHGYYGTGSDYIIDTPAYTEWVCSRCGEVRDTQP